MTVALISADRVQPYRIRIHRCLPATTPKNRSAKVYHALVILALLLVLLIWIDPACGQTNAVATGDSVWSAVKGFFYGKWALVIGCLVLVGCVFAFFSKGAMFASIGVAAVVIIYLLPAIAQGLQSLAQSMVGN